MKVFFLTLAYSSEYIFTLTNLRDEKEYKSDYDIKRQQNAVGFEKKKNMAYITIRISKILLVKSSSFLNNTLSDFYIAYQEGDSLLTVA